ncbi:MAG: choline-sulfatase [Chloroflexi bacterium]|nr:MAG: choline-sulfatase [Chloroflexota bacterium]
MEQKNVLMIVADQMVADLMGAYGHRVVQTPNINRLADEGIRFESAYTSCPICVPARASLLTGMYASRIGVYDNASMIPSDQPCGLHYLSIAGYETVLSGKAHFIGPDQLHGFEKRLTTDIFPANFSFFSKRDKERKSFSSVHAQPIAIDYVTAGVRQWSMGLDYDEETQFRALEYLRSKRSQYTGTLQKELSPRDERPFFLCVSFTHPHEPLHVTQRLWDLYENQEIDLPEIPPDLMEHEHPIDQYLNTYHGTDRVDLDNPELLYKMRRAYYGLITYIDEKVGELVQALEDLGLKENTLVIFSCDHGDMMGERRMVQKRSFYEYSSRIPLILSCPVRWEGRQLVGEPVSITDIMPTILDYVGFPEEKIFPMDGRSIIPLIEGKRDPDRAIFAEIHSGGVNTTCFMVRKGEFKYCYYTGYSPQLFNIVNDPKEWHNLAGNPAYQDIENCLYQLILDNFDPEQIEMDIEASIRRRRIIQEAMNITGLPVWDFQPEFDATKQYWRNG